MGYSIQLHRCVNIEFHLHFRLHPKCSVISLPSNQFIKYHHGANDRNLSPNYGGKWKVLTKTTLKSTEINFEVGKAFEETTVDGRKRTTTVTIEGNTMVTNQKANEAGKKSVK